jgi:hypothetical protein
VTVEEAADAGIRSMEHLSNYDVFGECLVNDSYTLAGCRRLFEKLAAKGVWQTPTMASFETIPTCSPAGRWNTPSTPATPFSN